MIEVVSAVIVRDGRILLTQRLPEKDYPFAWECPGGKVDGDESHHDAIRRELREELGVSGAEDVQPAQQAIWCGRVKKEDRSEIFLLMYPVFLTADARPYAREGQGIGWFTSAEMSRLTLTPGNRAACYYIAHCCRAWATAAPR